MTASSRHPIRRDAFLLALVAMAAAALTSWAPSAEAFGLATPPALRSDMLKCKMSFTSATQHGGGCVQEIGDRGNNRRGRTAASAVATTCLLVAQNGALVTRSAVQIGAQSGAGSTRQRRSPRRSMMTCRVAPPRKYGSSDWLANIQNLPKSRLLYNIRGHLAFNTAFAVVISLVHFLTPQHIIDDLHVSPIPHSIMSGALGLLLVFRTNAAYNRFWEARKVWGSVVNTCRNLARLGAVSLGADSEEWGEMKEYVKMFPFLLKQHLQNQRDDVELAFSTLPMESILTIQEDPNPPLAACQTMSEIVARGFGDGGTGQSEGGRVLDFTAVTYRMELERCLSGLIDCLGMCERILTTPVPRGYSRHTSRFLTVYGMTLPLVLVPHTELFTGPVVGAVCWGLFSIEEIAYFIEQPFDPEYRQLDMKAYSEKIKRDIERMTVSSSMRGKRSRIQHKQQQRDRQRALGSSTRKKYRNTWSLSDGRDGTHPAGNANAKAAAATTLFSAVNGSGGLGGEADTRETLDLVRGAGAEADVEAIRGEDYSRFRKFGGKVKWREGGEDDIVL